MMSTLYGTCVRIEQTSEALRVTYEICKAEGGGRGLELRTAALQESGTPGPTLPNLDIKIRYNFQFEKLHFIYIYIYIKKLLSNIILFLINYKIYPTSLPMPGIGQKKISEKHCIKCI